MLRKLQVFQKRYDELSHMLYDPAVASDGEKFSRLMKELKSIEPIYNAYKEYSSALSNTEEALAILSDPDCDEEMKALAQEELEHSKKETLRLEGELKILLLPKDENDDKNVIVEIRAGAGGEEAALFAYELYRMYTMYAEKEGFKTELINSDDTELGGVKEVSFSVEGQGAFSKLKFESGVHRVQRVPETESGGRIHTSTVTVAVLPEAEEVDIEINPKDLKIDTFRSSGAGGQHINKTSSAIRITHLPTGTVVECQDERSQYKNKDKAMKVLRSRLLSEKQREQQDAVAGERKSQVGTGDRSEKIRTYNFHESRVTDHRIKLTLYRLEAILSGELSEIIDPLIAADRAAKLQESIDS